MPTRPDATANTTRVRVGWEGDQDDHVQNGKRVPINRRGETDEAFEGSKASGRELAGPMQRAATASPWYSALAEYGTMLKTSDVNTNAKLTKLSTSSQKTG